MYGGQKKTMEALKTMFLSAQRAKLVNISGVMRTNNEGGFYEFD